MGSSASTPSNFFTKSQHQNSLAEDNINTSCSCYTLESSKFSSASSSSSKAKTVVSRALSLPLPTPLLVHHPPSRKGDTHHLVSLTSTTYGYSSLILIDTTAQDHQTLPTAATNQVDNSDSVINTWELMDGLDVIDFYSHECDMGLQDAAINSSFGLKKPLWKHLSEESLLSNMDPNVALSYRRALSSKQLPGYQYHQHQVRKAISRSSSVGSSSVASHDPSVLSATKNQILIVIYFTSLRGIRKTYDDCCSVRMIFKSYRVAVDERDISMDSTYRRELQSMVGGKTISLPQVFIREEHIGGAEEIKQLNEAGELGKLLQGFPLINPTSVCGSCGDARFMPCPNCCGSRKVFDEEEDRLKRCPRCNENGLTRCPSCCSC